MILALQVSYEEPSTTTEQVKALSEAEKEVLKPTIKSLKS
jgi:hypothetical protein